MTTSTHPNRARAVVALLAGLLLLLTACSTAGAPDQPAAPAPPAPAQPTPAPSVPAPVPTQSGWPVGLPASDPVTCPPATVPVSTPEQLQAALDAAAPGTVIGLADGTYPGEFSAAADGTTAAPIWLCGSPNAVLQGPGTDSGIVLHLQQVSDWRLVGFGVRDGQKGVMADGVTTSVLQDLTVTDTGDEAVHLRTASTGNVIRGLTISDTGHRKIKYGEGIYIGTAVSNWCQVSGCGPDRSDGNVIVANTITATTAENVDIKEGTTGGVLAGNTFNGTGMKGDADSWVDIKGNNWLVQNNHGTTAATSGFQINQQADGWGTGNTLDANTAQVTGPGYGYELRSPTDTPAAGNHVTCTNTATDAGKGLTNTTCT